LCGVTALLHGVGPLLDAQVFIEQDVVPARDVTGGDDIRGRRAEERVAGDPVRQPQAAAAKPVDGEMFYLDHGLPNSLAPGKRPRTTLSPSLAMRDGRGYLAFGTPGGDQQDQWSLLFFLRHVHHRMNLQQAIDAPAWHTTRFPSSFYPREAYPGRIHMEGRAGAPAIAGLRDRGHDVRVEGDWSIGRISAVSNGTDGLLRAGANPRGMQGYASGR
jgi:gamma-glutamyltranspeptidase / glutathione hydrolase